MKARISFMKLPILLSALALACLLGACSTTYEARKVQPSGFLGDYSQLEAEGEGLLYVDRDVKGKYPGVILEPVRLYASTNGRLSRLSPEDQQVLVNYLHAALQTYMTNHFAVADEAGPGVMRVRMAITEARAANVPMDVISTLLPIGLAVSAVKRVATGAHSAVGSTGIECEAVDSVSGRRLFAFVDARVGRKVTGRFDKLKQWHTAQDAFDFWAQEIARQLEGVGSSSESESSHEK